MALGTPIVPQVITVHLGTPKSNVRNVTLPFGEYIKNAMYTNHRTCAKACTMRFLVLGHLPSS